MERQEGYDIAVIWTLIRTSPSSLRINSGRVRPRPQYIRTTNGSAYLGAELDDIVSTPCRTHDRIDDTLRTWLSFIATNKGTGPSLRDYAPTTELSRILRPD